MKVVNWSEFHFPEVKFFQNWYFNSPSFSIDQVKMGFRILILLLISVHAISARPQSDEEYDDAEEEWEVECGLHNKNGIEGGSPEGGLILDFFHIALVQISKKKDAKSFS